VRPALVTIALALALSGCGGTPSSSSPTTPKLPAAGTRIMELTGDLAFGNTQVGTTVVVPLDIKNLGTGVLTVTGLTLPNGYTANWTGGTILAGHRQAVAIAFLPSAVQPYPGSVVVSADQTVGANTIGVSGTGVSPSPNIATLISPANGAVLPQGFAGVWATWTFTWSAVPGATSYRLYVRGSGALPLVNLPGLAATTYDYQLPLGNIIDENLAGWQWMVQSDEGWSLPGTFSVAPAAAPMMALAGREPPAVLSKK